MDSLQLGAQALLEVRNLVFLPRLRILLLVLEREGQSAELQYINTGVLAPFGVANGLEELVGVCVELERFIRAGLFSDTGLLTVLAALAGSPSP